MKHANTDLFARGWLTAALACASISLALLVGCRQSNAQSEVDKRAPPRPASEQLREAANPGYATAAGTRQECLGRLVFDVAGEVQWGISPPGVRSGDRYRFTEKIHGGHDDLWIENLQVLVIAPANRANLERMAHSPEADKNIGIGTYRDSIKTIDV